MMRSRILGTACLAGMLALVPWSPPAAARTDADGPLSPIPEEAWTVEAAGHLLARAGFGGTPDEVRALHALGLEGAVDALVHYRDRPFPDMPVFEADVREPPPRSAYEGKDEDERREVRQTWQRADRRQLGRLREWWLRVMILTPRPLEERMTLFWHGHFTSGWRTVRNAYHLYIQNATLRGNAVGSFRTLLHEIARDPAMLRYLDGFRNRKGRPNENFAREVMELFTLGEGHYTEQDVKEAARAFTGWTYRNGRFVHVLGQHDDDPKCVLGTDGPLDGHDVLEILLAEDQTARHVVERLYAYFTGADPEPEVVDGLASTLREADYEIAPVLEQLFLSRAFHAHRGTRVKGPVDLVVGLFRTLGAEPPSRLRLGGVTAMLGQELFEPPNVKGWEGGRTWISTSGLLARYNVAAALVGQPRDQGPLRRFGLGRPARQTDQATMMGGEEDADGRKPRGPRAVVDPRTLVGAGSPGEVVDALALRVWGRAPEGEVRSALAAYLGGTAAEAASDTDAHPAFDPEVPGARDRLHGLLRLLVSTPEFQLH